MATSYYPLMVTRPVSGDIYTSTYSRMNNKSHAQRSQYPPGYTGHQSGRYSIVGSPNPAGAGSEVPRGTNPAVEVQLPRADCSSRSLPVSCEQFKSDTKSDIDKVYQPSARVPAARTNTAQSVICSTDFEPIQHGPSCLPKACKKTYCNPAYVSESVITTENVMPLSERAGRKFDWRPIQALGIDRLDSQSKSGFAIGHNTDTRIWSIEESKLSKETEYRHAFKPDSVTSTNAC